MKNPRFSSGESRIYVFCCSTCIDNS
ncbi:TRASH domain-containing protein [Bacteroides ovatus]|uniref:TRASH domain-containing protein n=1 Tax=Bacteroides ovatus TaxID=28116 RepID=A0A6N3VAF5_BACOV|nr:TRASH domain-containing protein [Bacteroides ovatus]MBV3659178.1 TRASH domain-containing protein [Bacteroides sp. MSK.18.91]MBV3666244.1 TRASH domain-containing protein [Bacteroides sp. MSK.18.83]MBV3710632.1 TRASH domain-containing protein [Bacteroides sp. MSK.18.39]MBV3737204.1 TRASH domain-containing protein [Bacteroides sp. MSK.18.37]MBV3757108.1 TRASH domain-containing protein [Bacteroides sp. MSK.18.22]